MLKDNQWLKVQALPERKATRFTLQEVNCQKVENFSLVITWESLRAYRRDMVNQMFVVTCWLQEELAAYQRRKGGDKK